MAKTVINISEKKHLVDIGTPKSPTVEDESRNSYDKDSVIPISTDKTNKMSAIIGDGTFETVIKNRTKQRKQKDDHIIAELRMSVENFEKALTHEIQKRLQSTASIESLCVSTVSSMEERLNKLIDKRIGNVVNQLVSIEEKLNNMNDRLEEEKGKIPIDIEQRGKEIRDMIVKFQEDFVKERHDRLNREGRMMRLISDHTSLLRNYWNEERMDRKTTYELFREKLDDNEKKQGNERAKFKEMVNNDLQKLKNDLIKETKERKLEDDEIVDALNRYTDNVQNSLNIISSSTDNEDNNVFQVKK